jgi:hypothetical protein
MKSGLSYDAAVRVKVRSSNAHVGDQSFQSILTHAVHCGQSRGEREGIDTNPVR